MAYTPCSLPPKHKQPTLTPHIVKTSCLGWLSLATSSILTLKIPLQSWSALWHGLYCLSSSCPDTYWINGSSYRLQFVVNVKPDFAHSWSWLFQGWWLFWRVVLSSCPFTHNHIYFHLCRSLYKPDISYAGFEFFYYPQWSQVLYKLYWWKLWRTWW